MHHYAQEAFPRITSLAEGKPGSRVRRLDISKLRELGIKPRPEAEALVDMARTLIVMGVAKPTFS